MINFILTSYRNILEQYLSSFFFQPEGMVDVSSLSVTGEEPCKLLINLLNIEKEKAADYGIKVGKKNKFNTYTNPPIYANIYIILAAVYNKKRYKESLSIISHTLTFLQLNPLLKIGETSYHIEFVASDLHDINNVWSISGGSYYPSIICKIRGVVFDSNEITKTMAMIKSLESNIHK